MALTLGPDLRRSAQADKVKYVEQLADNLGAADAAGLYPALRKILKPKKFVKDKMSPLPAVRHEDGTFCRTTEEQCQRWRDFFSQMQAGKEVTADTLFADCVAEQTRRGPLTTVAGNQLPSMLTMERTLHTFRNGKAPGLDGVPPEICRRFATPIATLWWPVIMKAMLLASEPLLLKGVELLTIPKGRGDPSHCASSRGIALQSTFAKVLQKTTRGVMSEAYERNALPMQIGGRKGLSAIFGSFTARSFLRYCRQQRWAAALLFVDISAAYYSVIRELVTGSSTDKFDLLELAAGLNLAREDLQVMADIIRNEPALAEASLLRSATPRGSPCAGTPSWLRPNEGPDLGRRGRTCFLVSSSRRW